MESIDFEVCKIQVRKVAQDILMFVWFKNDVIPEKPSPELSFVPEITSELLNNLCISVLIELSRNEYIWEYFLKNHFHRLSKTPYLFANYFAYASYILTEKATDALTCFVGVLSLVATLALHCWQKEDKKFLNSCVDLFCAFFDEEICEKFEDQGRWRNFNDFLESQESLRRYKELISANKHPIEFFKELQSRHQESNEPYVIDGVVLKDITVHEVENHKKAVSFADSVAEKMKELCNKTFEEVLKDFPKTDNQVEELYRKTVGEASGGMSSVEDQYFSQEVKDSLENVPSKDSPKTDKYQIKEVKGHKTFKEEKDFPRVEYCRVIVTAGEMASDRDQSSLQEVQETLQIISSKHNPEKIEDRMKEGKASDPLETQDFDSLNFRDFSPTHLVPSLKLTKAEQAKALLEDMMADITKISELIKFVCEDNAIKVPDVYSESKL